MQFSIKEIWNAGLDIPKRETKPRDRIYASELGRIPRDVVMKLNGVEPSNQINERALRKMEQGELFELQVHFILKRAGVLISTQDAIKYTHPGCIEVSGKIDFRVGGKPDYDQAEKEWLEMSENPYNLLTESFKIRGKMVIKYMREKYPNGIPEQLLEIKSAALSSFDRAVLANRPYLSHLLQLYHYTRNTKLNGLLIYICKDDGRIEEFVVKSYDEELEQEYIARIKLISQHYKAGTLPDKIPLLQWDPLIKNFYMDVDIKFSPYLTLNYGIEHEEEYRKIYSGVATRWNTIVNRIKANYPIEMAQQPLANFILERYDLEKLIGKKPIILSKEETTKLKRELKEKGIKLKAESEDDEVDEEFEKKKAEKLLEYFPKKD